MACIYFHCLVPSIVVQNGGGCCTSTVKSTVMGDNNTARQKSKLYKQDEVQDVDDPINFTEKNEEINSNNNGDFNGGDEKSPTELNDSGNKQDEGSGNVATNAKTNSKVKLLVRSHAVRDDTSPPPPPPPLDPEGANTLYVITSTSSLCTQPKTTKNKQLKSMKYSQSSGNSFNSNSSSSLSRESSYEAYTDTTGINLEDFLYKMLNNKSASDRNMLLKIEKDLIDFINKPNEQKLDFEEMDSYHRMLVHRVAAYFGMEHNIGSSGKSVVVNKTKNTRIPEPFHTKIQRLHEPQKSILKRDSGSLDDKEYRSSDRNFADSRRSKSFEEREEQYKKTRARIFNENEKLMDQSVFHGPIQVYGRTSDGSTLFISASRLSSQEDERWHDARPWSSTDSDSSGRPVTLPVKALNSEISIETMVPNMPMVNGHPQITKSHSDCHENMYMNLASRPPVTKSNSFSSVSYLQVEPFTSAPNLGKYLFSEPVISSSIVNTVLQNQPASHVPQTIPAGNLKSHQSNSIVPNSVVLCQDQATATQYPVWKASNQNVEAGCQTTPIDNSYQRQQYVVPGMESVPSGSYIINPQTETGSVMDASRSGRPSILTEEKLEDISDRLLKSPSKSLRKLSQQSGLSLGLSHKAVKKELKLYPYKVTALQELKDTDFRRRMEYCEWFNNFIAYNREDILDVTFFTDGAWFHLSGYINSQNSRLWCSENPHSFHESPLHSQKVGVWLARSPDLTPPDFYLWGAAKGHVYKNNPRNIDELKLEIKNYIQSITAETLRSVFVNKIKRVNVWYPYCNPDGSYYVHNPGIKPIICQPPPNHSSNPGREVQNFPQATPHHVPPLPPCNIPPPSVPPHQQSQIVYYQQHATHIQQDSTSSEGDLTNRMSMMALGQSQPMSVGPENGAASDSLPPQQPVNNVTFSYVSQPQQPMCMMQPSAAAAHVPQAASSGHLAVYPSQQQMQYHNQPSHVYYSQAIPIHNQVQHVPPPSNQYTSYGYSQVQQPETITYNLGSSSPASYQPQLMQSAVKTVPSSHFQYGCAPQINHIMPGVCFVQPTRTQQNMTPVTSFQINQNQPFVSAIPQISQVQPAGFQQRQLISSASLGANGNIYQHTPHPITPSTTPSPQFQSQSFPNGSYNLSYPPNAQVISGTSKHTITPPPNILAHISSSPQLTKSCSFPPMDGRFSTDHSIDSYHHNTVEYTFKTNVFSIAQDIASAVSNCRKLTSKHIGLNLALHQATRSESLVKLFHKANHTIDIDTVRRFDPSIANNILKKFEDNNFVYMPDTILKDHMLQCSFDNIDVLESTLDCKNTFHSTQMVLWQRWPVPEASNIDEAGVLLQRQKAIKQGSLKEFQNIDKAKLPLGKRPLANVPIKDVDDWFINNDESLKATLMDLEHGTRTEFAVVGAPMHQRPKYPNQSPARMPFNRTPINRYGSQQWIHTQPLPQMPVQGWQHNNRGRRNNRRIENSNNNSNNSSNRSSQNQTPTGRNNILEAHGFPNGMKQPDLERYLEDITVHGGKIQYQSIDGTKNSAIIGTDLINSSKHKVLAAFDSDTSAQSALLTIKSTKFQLRSYHPSP
ncbi:R3H domain-containing protein 2 [Nymphon striatum]|nr:R3H domain-containing protein 2 [Nymphon striatum]